jgi:hypothetical protein
MLDEIVNAARAMGESPGFTFERYAELFSGLRREDVVASFNRMLQEILDSGDTRGAPYYDQLHLASEGEFNLTLTIAGRLGERPSHITASEFDLLVVNLGDEPVAVPVYQTTLDKDALEKRPGPLLGPEQVPLEPRGCRVFMAYTEIADLAGADREAPLLVVHSTARGSITWVFDRESAEPIGLTDNNLQTSRVRMAARVMGELRGSPEVISTLEQLASSRYGHFVRWEAAEAVFKLDPARGSALLRDSLAQDEHPSIRKAARATLDNIAALETSVAKGGKDGVYD